MRGSCASFAAVARAPCSLDTCVSQQQVSQPIEASQAPKQHASISQAHARTLIHEGLYSGNCSFA